MKSIYTVLISAALVLCNACGEKGSNPIDALDAKEKIECGNGKITFVYKNPEKFFPEYVKEYDVSIKANQKLIADLGELSVGFKDSVVKMMNDLDQENSR